MSAMLSNRIFKTALLVIVIALLLPISNYIVQAIVGLGRIIGTYIRILGTI